MGMGGEFRLAPAAVAVVISLGLAGCGGGLIDSGASIASNPSGTSGSALGNLMRFGTTTPPEPLAAPEEEIECPPVSIAPGGAALRIGGGASSESVRSQITITDVARECARSGDGGVIMRVGAEGRVLVGPAGSSGALGSSLRIEVRKGDAVVASRVVRVGASIPAGQAQAGWSHIENGIAVPGSVFRTRGDIDVFVSLNSGAAQSARRR